MPFRNGVVNTEKPYFKPHSYQVEGIKWVCEKYYSGVLFPPGLGKTAVVLSAFKILRHKGEVDKMFVIAPLRVCHMVWPVEVQQWADFEHLSVGVLHGKDKDKVLSQDHDIYVINPDGIRWFSTQIAKKNFTFKFDKWLLVCDESTNFKNHSSQRFKSLKRLLDFFDRRVILTGTPVPNGLSNLWSQVYILDKGTRLGHYITQFRNTFFYPAGYMGYEYNIQPGAEQRIYELVDDIVMHKSQDELSLPPRLSNEISVCLPDKAQKIYKNMKNEYVAQLSDSQYSIAVNAAVATGKLKQIANGALYNEDRSIQRIHYEKISAVRELYDSLGGRPLMVFYEYRHDLEALMDEFPGTPYLGGGVSAKQTSTTIGLWNNGELKIMFLHPASCGHGLNLQHGGCHDICWYSIPFDLEIYDQANARVHRQGVKNSVIIHHIVSKDTIDERIMKILKSKDDVQKELLNYLLK